MFFRYCRYSTKYRPKISIQWRNAFEADFTNLEKILIELKLRIVLPDKVKLEYEVSVIKNMACKVNEADKTNKQNLYSSRREDVICLIIV